MKHIEKESFRLEKVRLTKDGGLDVHYVRNYKEGALSYTDREHIESTKDPHPDLVTKISTLKPILAKMWGYADPKIIVENEKFKATPDQIERIKRLYNEQLQKIEVTGIVVRGEGEKMVVNITGKRKIEGKIAQPLNSPRIALEQKLYGCENDIEDLVPEIKDEVYQYLFEGKCANPTLFGDAEQKGAGTKEEEKPKAEEKTKKRKKGEPQPKEPNIV